MARRESWHVGKLVVAGASNGSVTVLEENESGLATKVQCATGSIPSAVAGYAVGCQLIDTTTGKLYYNSGSITSCTFNSIADITSAELADSIDLGASGTAGDLDIFPATAAKGKINLAAANNTNDSILKITNAAQDTAGAGTRTFTLPNTGGDANFVMSTAALTLAEADVLDGATAGTAAASKAVVLDASKDFSGISNLKLGVGGVGGVVGALKLSDGANPEAVVTVTTDPQTADLAVKVPDPGAIVTAYVGLSTAALTAAEMDVLDGAVAGNSVASKVALLDASKRIQTNANCGTVGDGVTAVEVGDGMRHTTILTVNKVDALTVADNAALADGHLIYTFPAGAIIVESAYMSMAVTAAEDTTATADVGLGTTEGSGANATLNLVGAGAAENILTGQTAADCNGTATVKTIADQVLVIEAAGDHTVYFNVADTWADTAGLDLTADIAGTVVLNWKFMA